MATENQNNEPLSGSGRDELTAETPACPRKSVRCNYWQDGDCTVDVCWMGEEPAE